MATEQPTPTGVASRGVTAILQGTQPWVRFLSIVGFVSSGVMVLIGLIAGTIGIARGSIETAIMVVLYPLFGVLYIFPSVYLLRYANRIRQFAKNGQEQDLAGALDAQRSFWRFVGVLTLVSLATGIIGMVVAAFGVAAGMLAAQ